MILPLVQKFTMSDSVIVIYREMVFKSLDLDLYIGHETKFFYGRFCVFEPLWRKWSKVV